MTVAGTLTVLENVMIGAFCRVSDTHRARDRAAEILSLMELEEDAEALMRELPIAGQKRVGLAMALATHPKLLMLDESAAGLNPKETDEMVALLQKIHKAKDLTLFVTEHVMEVVMPLVDRAIVLDLGRVISSGKPSDVVADPKVITAYLGDRRRA